MSFECLKSAPPALHVQAPNSSYNLHGVHCASKQGEQCFRTASIIRWRHDTEPDTQNLNIKTVKNSGWDSCKVMSSIQVCGVACEGYLP